MESHKKMLLSNKAWAREKVEQRANFFQDLSRDQKPEFLWIGCSDSRVPAEEVTGAQPGQIFVHRNVANLVISTDLNLLSVLQYAVETLEVKHIIVCGHYGCGGVRAALSRQNFGLLNRWLYYIKDNCVAHEADLKGLQEEELCRRMVEINVRTQVRNLSRMATIQRAWSKRRAPLIHGWVFELADGLMRELVDMGPDSPVDAPFQFIE